MSTPKCPCCGSNEYVHLKHNGKTIGTVGGAIVGGAAAISGTTEGAAVGAAALSFLGPVGLTAGALLGGILGCIGGASLGATTGATLGHTLDVAMGTWHCSKCNKDFDGPSE